MLSDVFVVYGGGVDTGELGTRSQVLGLDPVLGALISYCQQ